MEDWRLKPIGDYDFCFVCKRPVSKGKMMHEKCREEWEAQIEGVAAEGNARRSWCDRFGGECQTPGRCDPLCRKQPWWLVNIGPAPERAPSKVARSVLCTHKGEWIRR